MLTYAGRGYSEKFTENFNDLAAEISSGQCVAVLVNGPDDVCAPRLADLNDTPHCHDGRIREADDAAIDDLRRVTALRDLDYGDAVRLTHEFIRTMRAAFTQGTNRGACHGCEWRSLCDANRDNAFAACVVRVPSDFN